MSRVSDALDRAVDYAVMALDKFAGAVDAVVDVLTHRHKPGF